MSHACHVFLSHVVQLGVRWCALTRVRLTVWLKCVITCAVCVLKFWLLFFYLWFLIFSNSQYSEWIVLLFQLLIWFSFSETYRLKFIVKLWFSRMAPIAEWLCICLSKSTTENYFQYSHAQWMVPAPNGNNITILKNSWINTFIYYTKVKWVDYTISWLSVVILVFNLRECCNHWPICHFRISEFHIFQ